MNKSHFNTRFMCPMYLNRRPHHQRGSMLVMSLFVILVVAFLGASLVNLISSASQTTIYEVLGARARFAADSGVQKLASSSFPLNSSIQDCNQTISNPVSFSNTAGFANCSYTARCTTKDITVKGTGHNYYRFSSTGVCQSGDVWVSRTVSVDAFQER